jgi:hypothetical protein
MKKIAHYSSQLEAHIVTQSLVAKGLDAKMLGAKTYASHYLGGDIGNYEVYVEDTDYIEALEVIKKYNPILKEADLPTQIESRVYFKKAVMYSLFALFMIPLIFNYVSLANLKLFLDSEPQKSRQILGTIIILLMQLPSLVLLYVLIKNVYT